MNVLLHSVLCGVLVLITVAIGLYRKYLEDHCDHYIHLHNDSHDASTIDTQSAVAKRIDQLDKLRTGLIVAVIVYALTIAGVATYMAWNATNT